MDSSASSDLLCHRQCHHIFLQLKKAYHSVINIKCTSGFTWSDTHGAGISDRKDVVWTHFIKVSTVILELDAVK
jgi:hypothetical protein